MLLEAFKAEVQEDKYLRDKMSYNETGRNSVIPGTLIVEKSKIFNTQC